VFVQSSDGRRRPLQADPSLRRRAACTTVYRQEGEELRRRADGGRERHGATSASRASSSCRPEFSELWATIRGLDPWIFVPWFIAAILVKLVGIFANVWRWQILLPRPGHRPHVRLPHQHVLHRPLLRHRHAQHDGPRRVAALRDDPLTRKPIECTTALAVERLIGLVGLFAVILMFMPFAGRITQGQSFGEMVGAMKVPFAAAMVAGVLLLLQPSWFRGLLRLVPTEKLRRFAGNVIDAATAYSSHRGTCSRARDGDRRQVTTTLMYFCNAMSLATPNVHTSEVLFASAVMTFGHVRRAVCVRRRRARARVRLAARLEGRRGEGVPDRQPRLLDREGPALDPGGIILLMRRDPTLAPSRARTSSACGARRRTSARPASRSLTVRRHAKLCRLDARPLLPAVRDARSFSGEVLHRMRQLAHGRRRRARRRRRLAAHDAGIAVLSFFIVGGLGIWAAV
jgi:hypothetical protein